MTRISAQVPEELLEQIDQIATDKCVSRAAVVRIAVKEWLEEGGNIDCHNLEESKVNQ